MEMEEAKMDIYSNYTRTYPRSNARSRYRKPAERQGVAKSSNYTRKSTPSEKTPSTFKERLILQATICGGFLAVLLFFNIIDSGFTNSVTGWIDRNISYDMLAEEGGIGGWVDSVVSLFGNDAADTVDADDGALPYFEAIHESIEVDAVIQPQTETTPANAADSSRVDENILHEIDSAVDVYRDFN